MSPNIKKNCIYFDLDGTLIDSKEGITKSIQFSLSKMELSSLTTDELEWCVGPPLRTVFAKLINNASESMLNTALMYYRERYSEIGIYEARLYTDIEWMLSNLRQQGFRLFVATSKPEVFAIKILKHLKVDQYFEKIYGSGLDGTHSDKTLLLNHILEPHSKNTSVIVGDRKFDIIAALQNGIQPLGVTYGYGSREELEEAGAHDLCNSPNEVYHWINS